MPTDEKDTSQHPDKLQVVSVDLVEHIRSLIEGVEFNLDEPLSEEDEYWIKEEEE